MKKTIGKPENWQDFETLCKKLWGEIWQIQTKIKKNGRLGQPQAGIDIYGKSKGEKTYSGIQCKGKDDYSKAKLTKAEIDNEIEKAKLFKPKLKVLIFATTANKDAKIEEYVRLKDIEYQEKNFDILLYCWEDIVDLIGDNRDTYDWYVNEIKYQERYNLEVFFNDFNKELTLTPIFHKLIKRYKLKPTQLKQDKFLYRNLISDIELLSTPPQFVQSKSNNRTWCDFKIIMENTGNKVIEDWNVTFMFKSGIREIYDESESGDMYSTSSLVHRTEFISNEENKIEYKPFNNQPLIQKKSNCFDVSILPEINADKITLEWSLLARDFNKDGKLEIKINPKFREKIFIIDVYDEPDMLEDEIKIIDFVEDEKDINHDE